MNTFSSFLRENWERCGLQQFGAPEQLTCVILTPRFRTSTHVLFIALPEGLPDPVLVAKVPRLSGPARNLWREAANLRAIQARRPNGFDSTPRVLAFEMYRGRSILVETALVGLPLNPAALRADPDQWCQSILSWLFALQLPAHTSSAVDSAWYERLVEKPLRRLEEGLSPCGEEKLLLERTGEIVAALRRVDLPLVFEHGDLSHPNLISLGNGRVGVVDWELADPIGLPACDLFLFLTYAAFARHKARSTEACLKAFQAAFFNPAAWAGVYAEAYAVRLKLTTEILKALFVAVWVRYLANLVCRISFRNERGGPLEGHSASWLRQNRYYALWRYSIEHHAELEW
ncbi:MAG: aminoglycoside phosphotransferase family protein [Acidobacteriota bacterium]